MSNLTAKFRESIHDHDPTDHNAYPYNEAPQPIYVGDTNEIKGFVLNTHEDRTPYDTVTWQINPDGKQSGKLFVRSPHASQNDGRPR